jgi:hypothetical protein
VGRTVGALRAYCDGETLDIRVTADASGTALHGIPELGIVVQDALASTATQSIRNILLDRSEALPRLFLYLDGMVTITLDPCQWLEFDASCGELRLRVPVAYLAGSSFNVGYSDGSLTVAAENVSELPAFAPTPIDCAPDTSLTIGQRRFTQLLGIPGLNAVTRGCGLGEDGEIYCWNRPSSNAAFSIPKGPFVQLGKPDYYHVCGLRSSGIVDCFQVAVDNGTPLEPPQIPEGSYRRLSESGNCAILSDGEIRCWPNASDAVGRALDGSFSEVAGNSSLGCAIRDDGTLTCWQKPPLTEDDYALLPFAAMTGIYVDVAISDGELCALTKNGAVDCIASGWSDKLRFIGDGFRWIGGSTAICAIDALAHPSCLGRTTNVPQRAFMQLAIGDYTNPPCGLLSDGRLACWNAEGYELP